MTNEPDRIERPRPPAGYCTYYCGRRADGVSSRTGEPLSTCHRCRARYAWTKKVARARKALNHHDKSRAIYARIVLDQLLANEPPTSAAPDERD